MQIRLLVIFAAAISVAGLLTACSKGSPSPGDGSTADIGAGLSGPHGAAATVVASGLKNVSGLAEDGNGRLWATTAAFTDNGTDGLFVVTSPGAAPIEVVAGLHTPMGLLWIGDKLYVSSTEGVLVFSGFDGTKFASEQTLATFNGAGILGGMVLGSDGRIRLGISSPCDNCQPPSKWAAAVVSFLPDGTDARVEASGIRAPVGLAYVPGTNDLLVTMNQRDDLGDVTPGDYLAQVSSGQNWGFPGCYGQGGTACNGVPAAVAELDKHAAVSGVAVVSSSAGTSAYLAEWATGKVLQVKLNGSSGSYTGKPQTFITGVQSPVPIVASGGHALLIGDWATGTVYRVTLPGS